MSNLPEQRDKIFEWKVKAEGNQFYKICDLQFSKCFREDGFDVILHEDSDDWIFMATTDWQKL